jgi:hypothetical protein
MRPSAVVALLLSLPACAGRQPAATPPGTVAAAPAGSSPARSRRSLSVITADEIAENPGILNAFDLISRLRPNFLRGSVDISSPGTIGLRVDNGPQRDLGDLRTIDVRNVEEIRYYSPQEANVRFGIDTNIPVIVVVMKRLK